MSDNISPPAYDGTQSEKNYVIAVHALYLASAVVGISAIIGLIMAYVKSDSAEPWAESHYQYAIRTFWLGLLYGFISFVLCFVLIGFLLLFGVYIWFIVRSVLPIVQASNLQPINNPKTWWI
jgi:uncharacterized membrane protein